MARLNNRAESDEEEYDADFQDALTQPSKRERVKHLGKTLKDGPKKTLKRFTLINHDDDPMDADDAEIPGITDNPSFNVGTLADDQQTDTARSKLHSIGRAIVHPRQAAKQRAALQFEPSKHPHLSPEADQELIEAHEDLHSIIQVTLSDVDDANVDAKADRLIRLQHDRQAEQDAWITARHVKRARVARTGLVQFPRGPYYRVVDEEGHFVRFDWARYVGHLLLYLSDDFGAPYIDDTDELYFKRGELIRQAERVYVSSLHWQTWLLHVKRVYMWEDTRMTLRWLFTYLVLLKTGYIITFAYSLVIYLVLRHRYLPTTTTELRWSYERTMDHDKHVQNLNELIHRHGGHDWLDSLLDDLGPLVQQQLGDLADYLEIMFNFYDWVNPRATTITLLFWTSCALLSAFSSTEFGFKVVFWVCGIYFFMSRPIASRYPQYRHLASILRWVYWDIPTHAELAFQNLQHSAEKHRAQVTEQRARHGQKAHERKELSSFGLRGPTNPGLDVNEDELTSDSSSGDASELDSSPDSHPTQSSPKISVLPQQVRPQGAILSFRGRYQGRIGRLILTDSEVLFASNRPGRVQISISAETLLLQPFTSLLELRKCEGAPKSTVAKARKKILPVPREALQLIWTDGTEDRIEEMTKRDECFNTIIGFSRVRWTALQAAIDADSDEDLEPNEHEGQKKSTRRKGAIEELGKLF